MNLDPIIGLVTALTQMGDDIGAASEWTDFVEDLRASGDLASARRLVNDVMEAPWDDRFRGVVAYAAGYLADLDGKPSEAMTHFHASRRHFAAVGLRDLEAVALFQIGALQREAGDLAAASVSLAEATRAAEGELVRARASHNHVHVLHEMGEQQRAMSLQEECLRTFDRHDDHANAASARLSLGVMLTEEQRFDEALGPLLSAAVSFAALPNDIGGGQASSLAVLAQIVARTGDHANAVLVLDSCASLFLDAGLVGRAATVMFDMGKICFGANDYEAALLHLDASERGFASMEDDRGVAAVRALRDLLRKPGGYGDSPEAE